MPLVVDTKNPTTFPDPTYLTLTNFKKGVITLIDKSRLPQDALEKADNIFLVEDGQPSIRPGVNWFGTAPTTTATTTAKVPTAAAGTNWVNPTNVFASDNSRATYATTTQDDLKITGFDLSEIPSDAAIVGVTVFVEGEGADATAANRSVQVGLTKNGTALAGTRKTAQNLNQTTDTTLTFGSSSDLYGTTLSVAEVKASTFGVLLRAGSTNAASRGIDQVTIKVSYTTQFALDGFDYFDFGGIIHLVVVAGGYVHRSLDDGGSWEQCEGTTLTAGLKSYMNQNRNFLYLTNGTDQMVRYDGSTTLQEYVVLATPAAPTVAVTGLSGSGYTVYYKIAAVNEVGFSEASPKVTQTIGAPRENFDATSNYLTLTMPTPQTSQERVDIYFSTDDLTYSYLDSIVSSPATPTVTYKDDGTAVVIPSTNAPEDNTTQGPLVEELTNIGSRQYGVRDKDNRYRIWFTGTGNYSGAFSNAYDGGYLDWQPGGKFIPVQVEDYRDGKGTPLATIWCDSADGQGCVLQMSLDTLTIQDINITVPSANRLPGSRGTPAPGSVVNVLNDFMFINSQAVYNLGSRAQFLNLLSTDENSANIRPTVKRISAMGQKGTVSVYSDAKVYFSVALDGSDVNNNTMVFDTERKAWLPTAFTIGFDKFLRYTDTQGNRRLLCHRPGDTALSEINDAIKGDYGQPFASDLLTGLYPTTKDRYGFLFEEEMEYEFSNPQGVLNIEVIGYQRTKAGFGSVKLVSPDFSASVINGGWNYFGWNTNNWNDTSSPVDTFSESTTKKYAPLQKELNNIQWHIFTNSLDANYVLRSLQTWGTDTQAGHPSQWRQK